MRPGRLSGARLPSGGDSCVVLVDDDQPSPLASRSAAVNVELAVCRHVAAEPDYSGRRGVMTSVFLRSSASTFPG